MIKNRRFAPFFLVVVACLSVKFSALRAGQFPYQELSVVRLICNVVVCFQTGRLTARCRQESPMTASAVRMMFPRPGPSTPRSRHGGVNGAGRPVLDTRPRWSSFVLISPGVIFRSGGSDRTRGTRPSLPANTERYPLARVVVVPGC